MNTRSRNKAIKGRRNKMSNLEVIFQYPAFDIQSQREINTAMEHIMDASFIAIPDTIKVIVVNPRKSLRITFNKKAAL